MDFLFKELKHYLCRQAPISICHEEDLCYDDYLLVSDIPDGKYDNLHIYGVGMADVEFSRDVYLKPKDGEVSSACLYPNDMNILSCLEIMVKDTPRENVTRSDRKELCFGDLRKFLPHTGHFLIQRRENWQQIGRVYHQVKEIPEELDNLYVYGIGFMDNPELEEIFEEFRSEQMQLVKAMVLVLSEEPRKDLLS